MFTLVRALTPLLSFLLGLLLTVAGQAAAQTAAQAAPNSAVRVPAASDIDKAIEAARGAAAGTSREHSRPAVPVVPSRALDPGANAAPDLSQLARDYDRVRGQQAAAGNSGNASEAQPRSLQGLLIFASLGMPQASLERLVADAQATRATLVLRGVLEGSLHKTKARIVELNGQREVGWQIDPTLFDRFKVTGVPTFVLIDPARPVAGDCGTTQCQQPAFAKVAGDVTTRFALGDMARRDREFAELARRFAAPLGGLQ